ncbi:GAF and ANTAR domain-containing protein [Rhodococcus sp. ZPP]|uniref:GAF and ANTAR domain-containing protein n=1 Tax=Rhodococcus sp. ZPP TaxID=2749906 RepID=UPI001AD893F2|nr:GAF and ANTAR domain-containing protein [Rhodococcus sp. ZPP]QTJ64746.1 GAF and ANTAR domain-containing protein [Rhodococcus sp. ZPP]
MSGVSGNGLADHQFDALKDAIHSVYSELDSAGGTDRFLEEVSREALALVPGAHLAGVTVLLDNGDATTRAATDRVVVDVDRVQYDAGDGPCLEAARTQTITRADSEEATRRWPSFAHSARRLGVASYLSAPILLEGKYLGALNVYGRDAHGFTRADAAVLNLLLVAVRYALDGASRLEEARRRGEQLATAMKSRAVIEQAKGAIMAARRVSADEAFQVLVTESKNRNIKLRVIAEEMLHTLQEG